MVSVPGNARKGENDHDKRKRKGTADGPRKGRTGAADLPRGDGCAVPRECIGLIGEAWDIPTEEQREPLALLEKEQASLRTGEGHALPEKELPMNASGAETLECIWNLFEMSLRLRSEEKRTALYEMARWLEESQKPWDRIGITSEEQLTEKAAAS